jgi:hypothetical protein
MATVEQTTMVMEYFRHRPRELCATCGQNLEARPGVRLCRGCLEVAGTVLEAIRAEESRALMVRPQKGTS